MVGIVIKVLTVELAIFIVVELATKLTVELPINTAAVFKYTFAPIDKAVVLDDVRVSNVCNSVYSAEVR